MIRVSPPEQTAEGWRGRLARGARQGVMEGSRGNWYALDPAANYREMVEAKYLQLVGECTVTALDADSAAVEFLLDPSLTAPPESKAWLCELSVRIPRETYGGAALDAARVGLTFYDTAGKEILLDFERALRLRSEAEERELLEQLAAEARRLPDLLANREMPERELTSGRYRGRKLGEVLREATTDDVADFLWHASVYSLEYGGHSPPFDEFYLYWILRGAPPSANGMVRRARQMATDEEMDQFFAQVQENKQLGVTYLSPWFYQGRAAAIRKDAEDVHFWRRLLGSVGRASGIPAYAVAAKILEAEYASYTGKLDDWRPLFIEAAGMADALEENPHFESPRAEGSDPTRTYWLGMVYYQLGHALGRLPNYAVAAQAMEEAVKVLRAPSRGTLRRSLYTAALDDSADYLRRAGEFERARARYEEALEAYRRRPDRTGLEYETRVTRELAELAAQSGNYRDAARLRADALARATRYGFVKLADDYAWELGTDYWRLGEYDRALAQYEPLLPGYLERGDWLNATIVLRNIGNVYSDLGRLEEAHQRLERSIALGSEHGFAEHVARAQAALGKVELRRGEFARAEASYRQALAGLDPQRSTALYAEIQSTLGEMLLEVGKPGDAEAAFRDAATHYEKIGRLGDLNRQFTRLAEIYRDSQRADQAAQILEDVRTRQQAANDKAGLAKTLQTLAGLHLDSTFDFERARAAAEQLVSLAESTGDRNARFQGQMLLARYYSNTGREQPSLDVYRQAFNEAVEAKDEYKAAWIVYRLSLVQSEMERFDKAREGFLLAQDFYRRVGLAHMVAMIELSLGYMDLWTGDVEEGRRRLEVARSSVGDDPPAWWPVELLSYEIRLARREARLSDAAEMLRQLAAYNVKNSNRSGELGARLQIGLIQMEQREFPAALETWQKLVGDATGHAWYTAVAGLNGAQTLAGMGRYDEAEALLRSAIKILDGLPLQRRLAGEARAIGALKILLERARRSESLAERARLVDEARRLMNEGAPIVEELGLRRGGMLLRMARAQQTVLLGLDWAGTELSLQVALVPPLASPLEELDAAVAAADRLARDEFGWEAHYLRGRWRARHDDFAGAREDLLAAVAELERQALHYAVVHSGASGASLYAADKLRPFEALMRLYLDEGDRLEAAARSDRERGFADDAVSTAARARETFAEARNVLDRMRRYELLTTSAGLPLMAAAGSDEVAAAVAQYRHLIQQEIELDRRISDEQANLNRDGVLETLREKREQYRNQVRVQLELLARLDPELAGRLSIRPDTLGTFAEKLEADEALVQPVLLASELVVYVARYQDGEVSVRSFSSRFDIDGFAGGLAGLVDAASNPRVAFSPEDAARAGTAAQLAASFYDRLLAPAEPALEGVRTLLISATGRLRYLPFHLLLAPGAEGRRAFLGDLYDVVYLTSTGAIQDLASGGGYRGVPLVAVANPDQSLDAAEQEVATIEQTWRESAAPVTVLRRGDASVAAVNRSLRSLPRGRDRRGILHLATHGKAGLLPKDSYLVFADSRVPESEIPQRLRELYAVSLAVLSACETARGSLDESGAGVTGLGYTFEAARVKTVVATLWKLDSEAGRAFMESFYRHLAEGATVAGAMRQARSALRDSPGRSHPYYWAPFILIGQWR